MTSFWRSMWKGKLWSDGNAPETTDSPPESPSSASQSDTAVSPRSPHIDRKEEGLVATVAKDAIVVKATKKGSKSQRKKTRRPNMAVVTEAAVPPGHARHTSSSSSVSSDVDVESIPVMTISADDLLSDTPLTPKADEAPVPLPSPHAAAAERKVIGTASSATEEKKKVVKKKCNAKLRLPVAPGGRVRPWDSLKLSAWFSDGRGYDEIYNYLLRTARASMWHASGRVDALFAVRSARVPHPSQHRRVLSSSFLPLTQLKVSAPSVKKKDVKTQSSSTTEEVSKGSSTNSETAEQKEPNDASAATNGTEEKKKEEKKTEEEHPQEPEKEKEHEKEGGGGSDLLEDTFSLHFNRERSTCIPNTICPHCKKSLKGKSKTMCEYTGKLYCIECIGPEKCYIPGYVVFDYDLKQYPVSKNVCTSLSMISEEPLVSLSMLNPDLRKKVPLISDCQLLRQKLSLMKVFISTCTRMTPGNSALVSLKSLPDYYTAENDIFSISDLVNIQALVIRLLGIYRLWWSHVEACALCSAKGSFCEICRSQETIFPFQVVDVIQCSKCYGIFHRACYAKSVCPKCARRQARTRQL